MRQTATTTERFEVTTEIGRGSAGIVQLARERTTQREVAIKTILWPNAITDAERDAFRQKFLSGMKAASKLSHPGIVAVREYAAPEGQSPFVVMDFVKGPTLHTLLCQEGLKAEWVLSAADTLAAAVRSARHDGVVHPDLKPSNIMVRESDGEVKITDYGMPRFDAADASGAKGTRGSQAYLSPESIEGRETDIRSDLFSISVILYEMLCGMPPFRGNDAASLRKSILEDPLPSITKLVSDLCPGFDPFFARALAKDPAQRFANAESYRESLERLREEQRKFWTATPEVPVAERDAPAASTQAKPVAVAAPSVARASSQPSPTPKSGSLAPKRPAVPPKKDDGPSTRGPGGLRPFPQGQNSDPDPDADGRRVANMLWVWGGLAAALLLGGAVWVAWSLGETPSTHAPASVTAPRPASSSSIPTPLAEAPRDAEIAQVAADPVPDPTAPAKTPPKSSKPTAAARKPAKAAPQPIVAAPEPAPIAAAPPVEPAAAPPVAIVPARLVLAVKSSFKEAELTLLVDGQESYTASLSSDARGLTRVYKKARGKAAGNLEAGIEIAPGQHTITARVHNSVKDRTYEQSIEVDLSSAQERTLEIVTGQAVGPRLELKLN